LHPKGDGLKLVNLAGRNARATMTTFPYPIFEEAILDKLAEINPASILPLEKEEVSTVDRLKAKLAGMRSDIASLQASLKKGYSKALDVVLRDLEVEEEKVASEYQDALARSVMPTERAWKELPTLVEAVQRHGDEARLKIRTILASIVEDARLLLVRRGSYI